MQADKIRNADVNHLGTNSRDTSAQPATPPENQPPDGRVVPLHRFSLRRKSTVVAITLLAALCIVLAGTTTANITLTHATKALETNVSREAPQAQQAVKQTKTAIIVIGVGTVLPLLTALLLVMKASPRILALEIWLHRMTEGDLNYSVTPTGKDEIAQAARQFEVLRQQSILAQRLDLVQQLSDTLQDKTQEMETTSVKLRTSQEQVETRQKLAELGELTVGVAHEISNPLNLVQNFSKTSATMMAELKETIKELESTPTAEQAQLIDELVSELTDNMQRIQNHGDRANRIMQHMLDIGRTRRSNHKDVNINLLVEDHAMLAYHAARSQDSNFNIRIVRELDENTGTASVISEDIGRVILNLASNACYSTAERHQNEPEHQPTMWISTRREHDWVVIKVRDNGTGIEPQVMDHIFNAFFTTKPTDRGTGLGLSLSNDIVREHGGTITADSQPAEYTEFTVRIPTNQNGETTKPNQNGDSIKP